MIDLVVRVMCGARLSSFERTDRFFDIANFRGERSDCVNLKSEFCPLKSQSRESAGPVAQLVRAHA
jgi:hypothetical protein